MPLDEQQLLEALDRALANEGGEVELSAHATRQGATRFAGSRVTQTGDVEDVVVQARVLDGGGLGAARANALDGETLARTIARARAIARELGRAGGARGAGSAGAGGAGGTPAGFADGREPVPTVAPSWDEAAARAGAAERAALIEPAFRACARERLSAAGLAATSEGAWAVATRGHAAGAGLRRAFRRTGARLDVIASLGADGDDAARAGRYAVGLTALDAAALAEEACAFAARARDPIELPPAAYDVVLEPPAVAELLEWLALTSFGARSVEDGSSCLAGRRGERLTGPIRISDDAQSGADGCPTLPFDAEGTPTHEVVFLDGGVAGSPVHDRASAARAGARPTGHAPPIGDDLFDGGPVPTHVHLAAGPDDAEALFARVERGLHVRRFHYVNGLLDTRRGLMTGMTRDGLYLIEDGRPGRAVRNLRWTEPVLEAFSRLAGLGRARQVIPGSLSDSAFVCPAVLLRGWHFTGRSR